MTITHQVVHQSSISGTYSEVTLPAAPDGCAPATPQERYQGAKPTSLPIKVAGEEGRALERHTERLAGWLR